MIKAIRRFLSGRMRSNSLYVKSLAILTSGSMLAMLINGLYQIVQTRVFSDVAIGTYSYLMAIPLMFVGVTALRYDAAIVVEKDEHRALVLVKLSFLLTVIISFLIAVGYMIYILLLDKEYIGYIGYIPLFFLMLIGYGLNNILNAYNNRQGEYALISTAHVWRTFFQRGVALLLGVVLVGVLNKDSLSIPIMLGAYGLGVYAGIVRQSKSLRMRLGELKGINHKELFDAAKEYVKQPLYSTPALFVNSFSFEIIAIGLEKLYSAVVLAHYSVSSRVLAMPISVISTNVSKVFVEDAAREYKDTGAFRKAFRRNIIFLLALAIPMFVCMFFLAPSVCEWLFGEGWHTAGEYIRILALMFSFRLVASALSQVLVVCGKQRTELVINIMLAAASLGSTVVAFLMELSVEQYLGILCVTRALCYFTLIMCVGWYSKGKV